MSSDNRQRRTSEEIDTLKKDARREAWSKKKNQFLKNRPAVFGTLLIILVITLALTAPWVAPYPGDAEGGTDIANAHQSPSLEHPFGTDDAGRDILSRALFGIRISLLLGIVVLTAALSIGVPLGLLAGYSGGYTQASIMRVAEIFLAVPPLVLAVAVTAALGHSLMYAIAGITVVWWPWYARLINGEVMSVKQEKFVESSEALGTGKIRIMFREILPNVSTPILVKGTLDMGIAILVGATISFLGMGAQPPTPDLGTMMARSREYMPAAWWHTTFPGLVLFSIVLGFNLLGDGLRDIMDVELEDEE